MEMGLTEQKQSTTIKDYSEEDSWPDQIGGKGQMKCEADKLETVMRF